MLRALESFLSRMMGLEGDPVDTSDQLNSSLSEKKRKSPDKTKSLKNSNNGRILKELNSSLRAYKRAPTKDNDETINGETPKKQTCTEKESPSQSNRRFGSRSRIPVDRLELTFTLRPDSRRSLSILDTHVFSDLKRKSKVQRNVPVRGNSEAVKMNKKEVLSVEKKSVKKVRKSTKLIVETQRPEKSAQEEEELLPEKIDALKNSEKNDTEEAPQMLVVCSRHSHHKNTERIKYMEKFQATIPSYCREAIRGQKHGALEIKYDFPGIPTRKFALHDMEKYGSSEADWPVQAIYDGGDDRLLVYYEGWTCQTMSWQTVADFEHTAPDMLRDSRIKKSFMRALRNKIPNGETVDFVEHWAENKKKNPHHLYWMFEDMTYFHSVINKEYGLAPVFYMACTKLTIKPPYYAYTPINIISCQALSMCMKRPANKSFDELKENLFFGKTVANLCENPSECKCDRLFGILYAHPTVQYLKYRADSTIDFPSDFSLDRRRLVMECSDQCGCSSSCPRRVLQRGQQSPLVVYYETNEKGFGLRAADHIKQGSLVCEYTGEITVLPKEEWPIRSVLSDGEEKYDEEEEEEPLNCNLDTSKSFEKEREPKKDTSYEAVFSLLDDRLAVCALTKGNVARFINHSCSPSTVFVEVYSRRSVKDPLIPRVAVYAVKDIEKGEEITVAYWSKAQMKEFAAQKNRLSCRCGSEDCNGFLPAK